MAFILILTVGQLGSNLFNLKRLNESLLSIELELFMAVARIIKLPKC